MRFAARWVFGAALLVGAVVASSAVAQQGRQPARGGGARGRGRADAGAPQEARVVTMPVPDALRYSHLQRVWLVTPPAGATAFGLGSLSGEGHRIWAVLPSCRQPDPDDPRDPCPVGRVSITLVNGTGEVQSTEPQTVTASPDARRVQSFLIPTTARQVRIRILRRDDALRWEGAVESTQFPQELPAAAGRATGGGSGFEFDFAQYPAR